MNRTSYDVGRKISESETRYSSVARDDIDQINAHLRHRGAREDRIQYSVHGLRTQAKQARPILVETNTPVTAGSIQS
jgi:hypothetical protein